MPRRSAGLTGVKPDAKVRTRYFFDGRNRSMRKAIAVAAFALFTGAAVAESQFGIEVYPNAKADPEVARQLKEAMKISAKTYRTSDPVAKVADFYRQQKLDEAPGSSKTGAMFMKKGANLTIQNPWADMKTGKLNNDTLISIVGK
jgi:hypothetical protein